MINEGKDPLGSMGNDIPLAVLSDRPQSLFNYFKQLFAQVTNPPIDSIREHIVTSTMTFLRCRRKFTSSNMKKTAVEFSLETPILTNSQLKQLKENDIHEFQVATLLTLYFTEDLESGLERICQEAEKAIEEGVSLFILV